MMQMDKFLDQATLSGLRRQEDQQTSRNVGDTSREKTS
jgi:hypothetical protein